MKSLTKRSPSFFDTDLWGFPSRMMELPSFFRDGDLPRVNIREVGNDYEVELAVPGYKKEDLKVDVDDGVLTVSCDRREESTSDEDNWTRHEFRASSFTRSFRLPDAADEEKVNARYDQGVLHLTIPKRKGAEAKVGRQVRID